jgi:hypothetical protein
MANEVQSSSTNPNSDTLALGKEALQPDNVLDPKTKSELTHRRLTGKSLSKKAFKFTLSSRIPSGNWKKIARGELLGEIVKGFLSLEDSQRIRENFEQSPALRRRTDGVPGETLGTDLYKSAPDEYMAKTLEVKSDLGRLFYGTVNVPLMLRESLQRTLPAGIVVRSAVHDGIEYNAVRGIRWTDNGAYSLKFHDDQAQLRDPRQRSMETFQVEYPVAFNVYPSVSEIGGGLVVYNIAPDDDTRARMGLDFTGYPYPEELLSEFSNVSVIPDPGDLVILSGRFIHGVTGIGGQNPRILLNHFGGFVNPTTFVTWS